MAIYPYDPEGTLTTNVVKGTLKKETFPNKHNVLVPLEAPFFRKDFRLKKGDVTLIEGLDYYLVYYYKKAAENINKAVYGGVLPISDFDNVEYQLRTLGGGHSVPFTELGRYLNNPDLKDPRSTDWSELQRYPIDVEPIDPPANFEEAYEQDIIIRSIVKIKEALIASGEERDLLLAEVFEELEKTENYYNVNFLELHDKTEHKHGYTAEMVGALRKETTAVNALKAYGYTLAQMVDHAKEHGISMKRITELVDSNIGLIHGSLMNTLDAGIVLTTNSGSVARRPRLELIKDNVTADTGIGEVRFGGVEGVWLGAGVNAIVVPKVGGTLERPILNGFYMLVPSDVGRYLFAPESATLRATVVSTDTVQLSGDGTDANPINGRITLPVASTTKEGLAFLVDEWGGTSLSAVVTQDLITKTIVNLEQGGYASKSLTINGKSFDVNHHMTLGKEDIGLDRVDDTVAEDKPVTETLAAELDKKALDGHTHNPTDLENVVMASAEVAGLGKVGPEGFAKSADIETFTTEASDAVALMNNALPGWASSGSFYGDGSYLPAPVQGNYGYVGYMSAGVHGEWESDTRFVFLNVGNDTFGYSAYYHSIDFGQDGSVKQYLPTAMEYRPSFLGDAKLRYLYPGKDGVFIAEDSLGRKWIILTKGTMDAKNHVGYMFTGEMTLEDRPIYVNDVVYIVRYGKNNRQPYFNLRKFDPANAVAGVNALENVVLGGNDIFGNSVNKSSAIWFAPLDESTDPSAQARVIREDNGYWGGVSFSHGPLNFDIAQKDGKIKLFGYHRPYYSRSTGSGTNGILTTSVIIDTTLNTFEIVDPDSMKVKFTENGFTQADNKNTNFYEQMMPNNNAYRFVGKVHALSFHVHESEKRLSITRRNPSITAWDMCGREKLDVGGPIDYFRIDGATATPVKGVVSDIGFLNTNLFYLRSTDGKFYKAAVDPDNPYPGFTGLGPTSNHKLFSYNSISAIPRNVLTEVKKGYVGSFNQTRPTVCDNEGNASNNHTFQTDNTLRLKIKAMVQSQMDAVGTLVSDIVQLAVFGDVSNPDDCFLIYSTRLRPTSGGDIAYGFIFHLSAVVANNGILSVPSNATIVLIHHQSYTGNVVTQYGPIDVGAQSYSGIVSDGKVYYIGQSSNTGWVGWGGWFATRITKSNSGVYQAKIGNVNDRFTNGYVTYHPKFGHVGVERSGAKDAFFARPIENTIDGFLNVRYTGESHILFAVRAAESWQVYFTQPYPFYTKGKVYTIPVTEFDLRTLFPANYRNRTFYIHARADDTKAWYTIDANKLPDTDTRLYIGFVKTDDERIVELVVDNVRRYGDVGALLRHTASRSAHSGTATNVIANSPYGELKNQGKMDSFTIPTFKDIFDTWYRFSHQTEKPNVYPAYASELNNWSYIAADDSVECTANTVSYVGFISNEFVGDYVFNTFITSNDADNDLISIIVAAFKKGDIDENEHTLSITIDQTLNEEHAKPGSNIRLWDNNNQPGQTNIVTLNANRFSRSWNTSYAHVYVRKTGNVLKIAVENLPFPADMAATGGLTGLFNRKKLLTEDQIFADANYFKATVDLTIAAPKYARPARFGYGCCSQNRSKFWNIKRPGADLSSFYGSEETLRLALRKNLMDYRLVYGKVPMLPLAGDESLPGNLLANTARQDNYGDMFWPIGQYIGTPYNLESVAPTAPTYNRNGNDGQSRWFFAKMRFSLSKTTSVKLRVVADDWCTIRVSNGGSIVHTVPSMGGNVPNEFTWSLAAGDWAITFLVEEKESLNSPSHVGYEVYLDNVLTYKPSITETRVLTLMGGTSRDVPSRGESVPHAVRLPFERPAGTALSVFANRRAGNIRKQIVEATGYEPPVFYNDSEANLGGVRVDSVQVGNVIKDSIYIYTPLRSDGTADIEYQLRITKL